MSIKYLVTIFDNNDNMSQNKYLRLIKMSMYMISFYKYENTIDIKIPSELFLYFLWFT